MTKTLTPNPDQQKVADSFFRFLMTDDKTFVLSGGAGVGKTWLMEYISDSIMQTYHDACALLDIQPKYDTIVFTATTNKAAEVLENSINKPVQTIHSFLGLKVKENRSTGKTILEPTSNYRVRTRHVLFVDESSMIDKPLYDFIMEAFKDSKIVFVGDHAQMAPVDEVMSPVYKDVDPDNFVFLGKPVRNANQPALMALCKQLRDTVETGVFHPMEPVEGVIDYLSPEEMEMGLEHYFKQESPSVRVLCYTNQRVQTYNEVIREIRGLPPEYVEGDQLIVAQAYQRGMVTLAVERSIEIMKVDPDLHNAQYAELTDTGEPLMYRVFTIKPPAAVMDAGLEVKVIEKPQLLKQVLTALKRQKRWSEFFDLKGEFLDMRDKYACTVYKSQGSTYEAVFIDLGNIGTSFDAEQVARMLFVGVSRATSRVFFYGELPSKYIGRKAA